MQRKHFIYLLIAISVVAYLTRPVWHPLFMLFYTNPSIAEAAVVATLVAFAVKKQFGIKNAINAGFASLIVLTAAFLALQSLYTPLYLSHHLSCSEIKELPEIDPSIVRIVPKVVGDKYAMDALQFPRYTIDRGAIVFVNGTPYWGYGLIPEGFVNSFVLKDKGAIYVDMSAFGKKTKTVEESMSVGEGMYVTDNYLWQIYMRDYFVKCEKPYFVPYRNSLYIAVPLIGYSLHFSFPVFYTTPFWAGTAIIAPNGSLRILTPQQAENCPILKDQKLFPAELAREYVDSFNFIHGIANVLFYHRDQFEIADVPGQNNQQPFLIATKKGLKWIIACEPYGQSYGIFRIYVVDARNGSIQLYQPSKTKALIGPARSVDYVKQAMPKVDWQSMRAVEPIPVVVKGKLYWQVRIIPNDASGIAYVAMVNAENPNDVIVLRTYSQVKSFLENGESLNFSLNVSAKKVAYYLIIKRNNSIIEKIPVYPDERVEVVPGS